MRRTASGQRITLDMAAAMSSERTPLRQLDEVSEGGGGGLTKEAGVGAAVAATSTRRGQGDPAVILSVFWCGTGGTVADKTTQVSLFARLCEAVELDPPGAPLACEALPCTPPNRTLHVKMSFDGVGRTHGCRGTVFAHGLRAQCGRVARTVRALRARGAVRVVALGLSRGGCAVLLLARLLAARFPAAAGGPSCICAAF
jgi:hypothetical protein